MDWRLTLDVGETVKGGMRDETSEEEEEEEAFRMPMANNVCASKVFHRCVSLSFSLSLSLSLVIQSFFCRSRTRTGVFGDEKRDPVRNMIILWFAKMEFWLIFASFLFPHVFPSHQLYSLVASFSAISLCYRFGE